MSSLFGKEQKGTDAEAVIPAQPLDLRGPQSSASGELGQAASAADDQASALALQTGYGNAAIARMLIQRKPEGEDVTGVANVASETSATQGAEPGATAPPTVATQALIVEDSAETVAPGQMKKGEFLSQLRTAVNSTTTEVLAGSPWALLANPYIDRVFAQYAAQDSARIEGSIRRYAPEAAGVTSAVGFIPIIAGRVRRSLTTWLTTGEASGVPAGLLGLPGAGVAGAIEGAVSGVAAAVGSAVSAVGSLLFKERDGSAAEVGDPKAVQAQLGAGQSLDAGLRARMESAFGESFGGVQVHSDANAAGLSENMNARAFTVGQHIAFGTGEYQPGTMIGDALIAHELAHVMQQRGGAATEAPAHKGGAAYGQLEDAADQAAMGAVVSIWGGAKTGLAKIGRSALPSLKSGLRLQRCNKTSSGPVGTTRLNEARTNFRNKNDHLTSDELGRIEAALNAVSGDNINLQITYFDYYSGQKIKKMGAEEATKATASGQYASTTPNSDTLVRPDLLDAGFPTAKLGSLLIHEITHTRHNTNYYGSRDYQEGESYGVEYFFAERAGEKTRTAEILNVMSSPAKLTAPAGIPALLHGFRSHYATMKGLYEIIDTGRTSHSGSPFDTPALLTRDEARALAAELTIIREDSRSTQLQSIMTWVKANLGSITGMPPV